MYRYILSIIIFIAFLISSCNDTFEPMQEDHPYEFSMYGFLDVHADTQYVRIMPIGKTLLPITTETHEYTVSLSRLSTQETLLMEPVKIEFGSHYAYWNYRTTEPIIPNDGYHILVANESGNFSSVDIVMPNALAPPDIEYTFIDESGLVTGTYSDSLILVGMYYEYIYDDIRCDDQIKTIFESHLDDGILTESTYRFRFNNLYSVVPHNADVIRREFHIAIATQSWPDLQNFSPEEMSIPTNINNVTNGTGYVGGIARRVEVISEKELEPCER